ncbi:MAG: hypothetical protein PHV71_06870 [Eubacteriales bacterium]|nr:hypothetical protein [Eubacteriales bacterium]MDD3200183.1 hypothetical protein [Eubacteriales bacterium]MDD4121648.1 hypothetical protein [Eubacteriales bacterium]MDD4630294.1 hypothetical protein [Eubacteriales bacterium]
MKKIKDIFYDLNDVLVALVIVVIAAFVIISHIDTILAYPSGTHEELQGAEENIPTNYAENPTITDPDDGITTVDQQETTEAGVNQQNPGDSGGTSGNEGTESPEPTNYSVYIEYGATGEKIADILVGIGLFESRQEFYNAVATAGAEGKLKAGTFIIPSDATPAEVVSILTK